MIATDIKTKIPEGWNQIQFGQLFVERKKSRLKVEEAFLGGQYPFFTSGEKVLSRNDYLSDGSHLFLATGGVANAKFFNGKASYSSDTYCIAGKDENTKLLFYTIWNNLSYINYHFFEGSGLKHLQKSDFKKFKILFPENPKEQQKIAEVLTTIDEAIEKTDAIIEKNKRIKQGLMQDLFRYGIDEHGNIRSEKTHKFKTVKIGNEEMLIPEEWEVATIPDILKKQKNAMKIGPFGSQLKIEYLVNSGYKVYGQENAFNKDFSIGKRYINKKRFNLLKTCELLSGDFIISMMGTIGQCAIIPNNIERGIMDSHLIRLQINEQKFNKDLLWLLIEEYPLIKQQIINLSVGGIMQGLSTKIIRQLMLMLPDIKEQDNITNLLLKISKVIRGEEVNKQKLLSLKRGLMEDLLTGTVRVNSLITN